MSDRALERLRAQAQSPVRARRNARQTRGPKAGRAHLHSVESEVAKAAEGNTIVPRLLQHQQALARGQLQTPKRCAEELNVCARSLRFALSAVAAYRFFVWGNVLGEGWSPVTRHWREHFEDATPAIRSQ